MLNVLFVCSGPTMYNSIIPYWNLDGMEKDLPADIYNYIVDNNLITYGHHNYPYLKLKKLPEEYIKRLLKHTTISSRDLDKYREYIIKTLKDIYPDLLHVNYSTVDPSSMDPKIYGDQHINKLIESNDRKYQNKYGITMSFQDHYSEKFQKHIHTTTNKYDVVWFLQCSIFSWTLSKSDRYIEDFKKVLNSDGLIIHMDWNGTTKFEEETGYKQPVSSLTDINKRLLLLPDVTNKQKDTVDWFLSKLVKVDEGVYKFKTTPGLFETISSYLLF